MLQDENEQYIDTLEVDAEFWETVKKQLKNEI